MRGMVWVEEVCGGGGEGREREGEKSGFSFFAENDSRFEKQEKRLFRSLALWVTSFLALMF